MERNILSNWKEGGNNFEIVNEASGVRINAFVNWWGCPDKKCIQSRILDFTDGGEKYGAVDFEPYLTQPNMSQDIAVNYRNPLDDDEEDEQELHKETYGYDSPDVSVKYGRAPAWCDFGGRGLM